MVNCMKKYILLLFMINAKINATSLIKVNDYVGYFGNFLQAINYAENFYPNLTLPHMKEIELANNLLNQGIQHKLTPKNSDGVVLTPVEKISDLGLKAVSVGSEIIGYTFPNSYAASILSGASFVSSNFSTAYELISSSLKGLKAEYQASEFTDTAKQQTTYLACSYSDNKNSFKIWAEDRLLGKQSQIKERLEFYKNTVLIKGRWVLVEKNKQSYYVFATFMDPLLLQSACIEAVTSHAKEKNISLLSMENIKISAGNTSFANSYGINFYKIIPMLKEKKPNPKFNVISKKAYLLIKS